MKAKEDSKSKKQEATLEVSKIDAIKDILFGENIQTYNKEFDDVKKDIVSKKSELIELINETRAELDTVIDNLSTDINIRITEIEDSLNSTIEELDHKKVDKSLLGNLFIKLGNQLND